MAQKLCSEKAYIRRQIDVKTTKCRDFTRILASFLLNSYNRRNIIVKTSQRRHFAAFLREKKVRAKKARARAYMAVYGDFARIFCPFKNFFAQKLTYFSLGIHNRKSRVPGNGGGKGEEGEQKEKKVFVCLRQKGADNSIRRHVS